MSWIKDKAAKWLGLSYMVDAANWQLRWRRPYEVQTTNTVSKEVNQADWQVLLSDSRKLYCNLGPVTGAIDDKATYSVGRSWDPKFTGKDRVWGAQAETWLREQWYPVADARGGMFDFKSDLFVSSVSIDRDGEIYIYLTESQDGWPQIQLIPAHMIGGRDGDYVLKDGPYTGLKMIQGVVVNDQGRAVAYNMMGETPDKDQIVSAYNLIQIFDPKWADQVRGFPCFMHALLDLKDLRTVQGYEKVAAMLMSSIGLMEKNETGAPDMNDPAILLKGGTQFVGPSQPSVRVEQFDEGTVRYFKGGSGNGLEQLKSDRPGDAVSNFMDRLIRNACVGAGWPYELTWDASKLGGANIRLLIAKAMRAVEDRQDLLKPTARRCCGYAVAKAIKTGRLPASDEWYKWDFTMPARMTADYGRESAADLADYNAGFLNLKDILGEQGRDLDQHIADRKEENDKLATAGLLPAKPEPKPTTP